MQPKLGKLETHNGCAIVQSIFHILMLYINDNYYVNLLDWFILNRPTGPCLLGGELSWGGVTKPISSAPLFSYFFNITKYTLAIEYHVHIWQVSPQLNCGDTC